MRIAVALCTYNGAAHLRSQLRSVVAQTTPPDELVVTDDASSDDTMAILEEELRKVPFKVDCVRNNETKGVVENFSQTLLRCTADVIALADQDDAWTPHRLERGLAPFGRDNVTATFSDAALIDGHGHTLRSSLWRAHGIAGPARRDLAAQGVWRQLLRWNCVTGATLAVRRDICDVALPIPAHTLHDEWLALVAAGLGEVVALDERLVAYRVHEDSTLGLPQRRLALAQARRTDVDVREHEAARFAELASRLAAHGVGERADDARAKATFMSERAALPRQAVGRLAPVGSAAIRRRYHRFAHGLRSAAHDLVFGP